MRNLTGRFLHRKASNIAKGFLAIVGIPLVLAFQSASAVVLSGEFFGVTRAATHPLVANGLAASGVFSLNTAYPYDLLDTDGSTFASYYAFNQGATLSPISVNISVAGAPGGGTHETLGSLPITLMNDGVWQSIRFESFFVHGAGAGMLLVAPSGSLFDGVDLNSLRPGVVDLSQSYAYYNQPGMVGAQIALSGLIFADTPLPEPGNLLLLTLGAILAASMLLASTKRRHFNTGPAH